MRRGLLTLILAALFLVPVLAGCGAGSAGVTSAPAGAPSTTGAGAPVASTVAATAPKSAEAAVPPALPSTPARAAARPSSHSGTSASSAAVGDAEVTAAYDLPAGWSVVSFPFSHLVSVRGLTHQVCTWRDGRFVAVDAGADPAAVDTRLGWLVYLEAPGQVVASGAPQTADAVDVPLQPGWNLVANPFERPLDASRLQVVEGDAVRSLASAVGPKDPLIAARFHGLQGAAPFVEDAATLTFEARGGRWVYALQACDLRWSVAVAPPVRRRAQAASTTGTVVGQVQSSAGRNIANARISLDSGQTATSATNGTFALSNVPSGVRTATISCSGYNTARGTITVYAGQTRTVYVQLSPSTPPPSTGTLYVRAYPFTYGGKRYWVSRIEVNEYGNYSKRWSNSWWSDLGYSSFDLACTSATVGQTYTLRVTWQNSAGTTYTGTSYRTFRSSGQTEYVYSP